MNGSKLLVLVSKIYGRKGEIDMMSKKMNAHRINEKGATHVPKRNPRATPKKMKPKNSPRLNPANPRS